jgi:hypothetical protein
MPPTKVIYTTSLADVLVEVQAEKNGVPFDPTGLIVETAFVPAATTVEPAPTDWKTSDWETDPTGSEPVYFARCLVGPGGVVALSVDKYSVFVRVHDVPEIPVIRSPTLLIVL